MVGGGLGGAGEQGPVRGTAACIPRAGGR